MKNFQPQCIQNQQTSSMHSKHIAPETMSIWSKFLKACDLVIHVVQLPV